MKLRLQNVAARHLSAQRGKPETVRDLSLSIEAGEQIAIIGPSGAGKTTLLHVLACALKPCAGQIFFDEYDPWQGGRRALQALRASLFLAPQLPPLPPRQRVVTAVLAGRLPQQSLWTSLRSLVYPSDIPRAEAALAGFDLAEKLFDRVDRLSGGERQRVGLARALVADASLMLIDEPLSALDPMRSQAALLTLTQAARERNASLVTTLHHVELALEHFPRIIGIRDGILAFDLPTKQVSSAHLQALYAEHLHELSNPLATQSEWPTSALVAPPVVMHCR